MSRKYLQRDNLAAALARAAPGDVLPEPRPVTVRYGGQPHEGLVHARLHDRETGWLGCVTYDREVTDGWWYAAAAWVPAHRIQLLD